MEIIERSIEVQRPIEQVYGQWTQFEEFPRFMANVEEVQQLDDTTLRWVAKVAGQRKQWDAKIVRQRPDQEIAWEGFPEPDHAGVVRFQQVEPLRTRVDVELAIEPEGAVETLGTKLGIVGNAIEGDLERFREFIESRPAPTGAWEGRIEQGRPVSWPDRGWEGAVGGRAQPPSASVVAHRSAHPARAPIAAPRSRPFSVSR
jgi:uncharacterized membrane protein